jgi:replication-associated recombination protein RarA
VKLRTTEATVRLIRTFKSTAPHALLLTGPRGVGLKTLAQHLASTGGRLLTMIGPESTSSALPSIKVERIRQLYIDTRATLDGDYFVIIDEADTMNHVAQNALLKLLEEPNESIHFILTAHHSDRLLATIRSRTQLFSVPPISSLESRRLIKSLGVTEESDERRLQYVADGLPAELSRLASNKADFALLTERVQRAREFVQGSPYRRLMEVQTLKDDRQGTIDFIETVVLLLRRSLTGRPDAASVRLIGRMMEASDAIRANGTIRLQLMRAVLMV